MVQPHVPPTITQTTRGNPTLAPHRQSPDQAGLSETWRCILVRQSQAESKAEVANEDAVEMSRCCQAIGNRRRVHHGSPIPKFYERQHPHWHPAIRCLRIRQNVAGLWLKYGAKSHKYRGFFAPQK